MIDPFKIFKSEKAEYDFIPCRYHVDHTTISNEGMSYFRVYKLEGLSHESKDVEDIQVYLNRLNNIYKSIASTDLAMWFYLIRKPFSDFPKKTVYSGVSDLIDNKYRNKMISEQLMVNEIYISIVLKT